MFLELKWYPLESSGNAWSFNIAIEKCQIEIVIVSFPMKNAGSLHDSVGNITMTTPTKISIRETRVQLSRLSQGMGAAQACHLNFMGFTWDSHGIHLEDSPRGYEF